jgi:hypothetical protein
MVARVSGCLGAIGGFVLVLALASAFPNLVNNDAWLIVGAFGGGVAGVIVEAIIGAVLRRRREASIPLRPSAQWPERQPGEPGTVILRRQAITPSESEAVRGIEIRGFAFALILAILGAGALAVRQPGWAVTLGFLALVSAIYASWIWAQGRDKTTVWAAGTIGVTSRRDYTSRDWRRVCTLLIADMNLDLDCDIYDRLASLCKPTPEGLLQFDGAVQFLPGSDVLLRIECPVGATVYERAAVGSVPGAE